MTKKINKATNGRFSYPVEENEHFTEADWKAVRDIIDWLNDEKKTIPGGNRRRTQTLLVSAIGASKSLINNVLDGSYNHPPSKWLKDMVEFINREAERDQFQLPLLQTSVYKTVFLVCSRAHKNKDFGLLSGVVGIGKTEALKAYTKTHINVFMIESDPNMSETVLLTYLVEKTGANVQRSNKYSNGTKGERFAAVVRKLNKSDSLIIVDEADRIMGQTLECLRRISDKTGIGVVLAGRERLYSQLEDERGRHGEVASRIGFWPPVIKSITPADSTMIVKQAFDGLDYEINNEVIETFWQMCGGKARVLVKLIRNVAEVISTQGHELSPTLVLETGQSLMGMSRTRKLMRGAK